MTPLLPSFLLVVAALPAAAVAQGSYSWTHFDFPGSSVTNPRSIDAAGRITGDTRDAAVHYHGFVRDPGGAFTQVDFPGAADTHLMGSNDSGVTVGGWSATGASGDFWYAGGAFTPMPPQPGVAGGPSGINATGLVVGGYSDSQYRQHGYIFDGVSFTTVDYPGAQHTALVDVNDQGQMAGNYWVFGSGRWRGFLYDGATFTPLDKPGAYWTYLAGLNDAGQVAGQQVDTSGAVRTAILYDRGQWFDLAVPGATGWTGAQDVNDAGAICGYWQGTWNGVAGQHGFLAEPVPSFALALAGTCPGALTATATGGTAGAPVAFLRAAAIGAFVVPSGWSCAGTTLGLSQTGLAVIATVTADPAGTASIGGNAPPGACGGVWLQAVDLATCTTSNVVPLH